MTAYPSAGREGGRVWNLDWFEWCCLAVLTGLSWTLVIYLFASGRTWTGGEGPVAVDQLQYVTWIREAGVHGLIGNRWDFAPDHRVFLHPGFLASGLIHRGLGLPIQWILLAWKSVALVATFFACLAWVRRLVDGVWARRAALFIGLFVVLPWSGLLKLFGIGNRIQAYVWGLHLDFPSGEIWTIQPLQGYPMTALSIALMVWVLLVWARPAEGLKWRRVGSLSVGALLVTWLQPWQGAELLLIIGSVEVWLRLRGSNKIDSRLILVFAAGALPAIYYALIGQFDDSWKLAAQANAPSSQALLVWPWWTIVATFGPLVIPAAFAFRLPTVDRGQLAARAWPIAAVAVYLLPLGTFPFHAAQGVMIPFAVLIVQGLTIARPKWLRPVPAWLAVSLLAFLSIPGTAHKLWSGIHQINTAAHAYTFMPGEEAALAWLEANPAPGGVLTDSYGGPLVSAFAGREAYVGPFSWTPQSLERGYVADVIFSGRISPQTAAKLVGKIGARFVLQTCHGKDALGPSLRTELAQVLETEKTFGCARVYQLKESSPIAARSALIGGPSGG
jgi:hypothetical protein